MNRPFALPNRSPIRDYERRRSEGYLPRGWIDGLTLSNDTTDAINDIAIAAGAARSTVRIVDGSSSTLTRDQIDLELPVGIIKQLDVAFAPENYDPEGYSGGDRSGGRSSSALSNTTWHALLAGGAGLQTDVFFHDSATQSNILAEMQKIGGYSAYRMIGSVLRESAAIVPFFQLGDRFWRQVPVRDINAINPGTSAVTATLSVPTGIPVIASISIDARNGSNTFYLLLTSPDQTDTAASAAAFSLRVATGTYSGGGMFQVKTNTSGQIRYRLSASGASDTVDSDTHGWIHPRGTNS